MATRKHNTETLTTRAFAIAIGAALILGAVLAFKGAGCPPGDTLTIGGAVVSRCPGRP